MNVITCNELTKIYGKNKALNDLSLQIEGNKITGLIGRNGAGKTTLLKIISGLLKQTSGEIDVFAEHPFNSLKVSANHIFVDDEMHFPIALNLKEILEVTGRFYHNWDEDLANRLFNYFSFQPKQYHQDLSKGMKSTFNMIVGLAARCPLTLFDEPTTGMDAAVRKDFYRAVLKDYMAFPRTIILSSHLLEEIESILEDIILIKEGKTLLHFPIAELKEYAIGFTGKAALIAEWTKDKEIFHKKDMFSDSSYVVVKKDFSELQLQQASRAGIEMTSVSSDDLCIYLTGNKQGGIDDVFDRG